MSADKVVIGRSTVFGNPVRINAVCPVCELVHPGAGSTLPCYRKYLYARLSKDKQLVDWGVTVAIRARIPYAQRTFEQDLLSLWGLTLVCPGCGIGGQHCHGRIMEKAIRWLYLGRRRVKWVKVGDAQKFIVYGAMNKFLGDGYLTENDLGEVHGLYGGDQDKWAVESLDQAHELELHRVAEIKERNRFL